MINVNNTAKSALIIIIFTLGSKFLGFIREVLIAARFGSGVNTDAFFISLTATGMITDFLRNSISMTFIPILSEIEQKEGKRGKIKHINNIVNVIFAVSIVFVVLGLISAPLIVKILAKGFTGKQFYIAVKLTRMGMPMILFSGINGVIIGYLNSEQRFVSSSAIGLSYNLVYIFYLLFLSLKFGINGLMIAAVVAVISQLLIQLPEIKKIGFEYKFTLDLKSEYFKKLLHLSIPVLIGVAINDLNVIVDKTLASSLISGSISALNYAYKLNNLILGVFISAITTVVFPLLAKEFNNNNIVGMKKIMEYGVNLILLITIPATVGLIVLAKPIVEVAFQRGEFDATATIMTSQALIFYSISLVAMAIRLLVNRVYYSLQDTKTPMVNGAISIGLNVILNLVLVKFMGHAGLAFATSIATTVATLLMFYGLKKKIGSLGTKIYITTFIKSGLASAVMGAVAYFTYHGLFGLLEVSKLYNLISLLVAVGIGVIVYGLLCYIFKVEEVREMFDRTKYVITRIRRNV